MHAFQSNKFRCEMIPVNRFLGSITNWAGKHAEATTFLTCAKNGETLQKISMGFSQFLQLDSYKLHNIWVN